MDPLVCPTHTVPDIALDYLAKTREVGPTPKPRTYLAPGDEQAAFPVVGERIDSCILIAELGAGSSGTAFLAQQETLGFRPLVLKVSAAADQEELNLARLQHTHIMPLFWAHALPEQNLHVIAMPYLARTTLAGLLPRLHEVPQSQWNGQRIFDLLQADQDALPIRIPVEEFHASALKQSSWMEFVLRMGQALAEALAYAHQRNLLHLDLKPANILVAPDGSPILLDLDVARQPIPAGTTSVLSLGGTDRYMSPEQHAAMQAVKKCRPIPQTVDGRSDQFALALVLLEALGGNVLWTSLNPEQIRRRLPHVPPGFVAILTRCLTENPDRRYADCRALADDLHRQLHDLPLRGVPNRLSERLRKWRRRSPHALPILMLMIAFCITAGSAGFNHYEVNNVRRRQAESALLEGDEWQRKGQHETAVRRFTEGMEIAEQTSASAHLHGLLHERLRMAQRLEKADELKKAVDLLRFYMLQDQVPRRLRHVLEAAGRKIWSQRHILCDRSAGNLEQAAEMNIQHQLHELAQLWTELQVQLAPPSHQERVRTEVRTTLAELDRLFGPVTLPNSSWKDCSLARIAMLEGRQADTNHHLARALELDPLGFVPHFYSGVAYLRQKKYEQAVQTFSYCLGQDPCAECFLLRGQALAGLGESERALKDINHAVQKNPGLGIAYQQRGKLHEKLGRAVEAKRDLELARKWSE